MQSRAQTSGTCLRWPPSGGRLRYMLRARSLCEQQSLCGNGAATYAVTMVRKEQSSKSCGQLVVAGNSAAHLGIVADNQGSGSLGACLRSQACSYHTQPSTPPYSGSEQGASNSEHATLSCHVLWPAYSVKHSQHNDYLMMVVSRNS